MTIHGQALPWQARNSRSVDTGVEVTDRLGRFVEPTTSESGEPELDGETAQRYRGIIEGSSQIDIGARLERTQDPDDAQPDRPRSKRAKKGVEPDLEIDSKELSRELLQLNMRHLLVR